MIKITNTEMLNKYMTMYDINGIFSENMNSFMELFLFKRNEYICRENEKLNYLFFFVDGRAKVYTSLSNGKALLLSFYEAFMVLGDLEVLNEQAASNNVEVIEDAYCIGISYEKVRTYLLNDAKFLRFICNSLGEKLNRCSKNSSINLLYPLENRLASYILATSKGSNANMKTEIEFNENLTEISELLGTSYRHLLRTINNLCAKKVLERKSSYYVVRDEITLRTLAADLYK